MFQGLSLDISPSVQHTVLILNTVLLIAALVSYELVYADAPKTNRRHLRYFYPILIILSGLLCYAIYLQVKAA